MLRRAQRFTTQPTETSRQPDLRYIQYRSHLTIREPLLCTRWQPRPGILTARWRRRCTPFIRTWRGRPSARRQLSAPHPNSRHQRHLDQDDLLHDRRNYAYHLVDALLGADHGVFQRNDQRDCCFERVYEQPRGNGPLHNRSALGDYESRLTRPERRNLLNYRLEEWRLQQRRELAVGGGEAHLQLAGTGVDGGCVHGLLFSWRAADFLVHSSCVQ
jgi:hypothetical protein